MALGICTDFAFAIAFDALEVDKDGVRDLCSQYQIDYTRFMLIRRRIDGHTDT